MGLALPAEDVSLLAGRTEGWVAGLQLAALAMQGRPDPRAFVAAFTQGAAGSQRYVFDYLIDEVVARQPEAVQQFLLSTAVLDRLCGPLCDALLGFDEEGVWFRYHHLFADVLRIRLARERPALQSQLHLHAAAWYAEAGLVVEAVEHALAARALERAAEIIGPIALQLIFDGQHRLLLGWLEHLPDPILQARPQLALAEAWALFLANRMDAFADRIHGVEAQARAAGAPVGLGSVLALRSHAARQARNADTAVRYAREALELLPDGDVAQRSVAAIALGIGLKLAGDAPAAAEALETARALSRRAGTILGVIFTTNALAETRTVQGALREAVALFEEGLAIAGERLAFFTLGGRLELSKVYRQRDERAAAEMHLRTVLELAEQTGRAALVPRGYVTQAWIYHSQGNAREADDALSTGHTLAARSGNQALRRYVEAHQARIALVRDDMVAALRWAEPPPTGDREADALPAYVHEVELLTRMRILIAQKHPEAALQLLAELREASTTLGGTLVEILVLETLARQSIGDHAGAVAALDQALLLGGPEGYVRVFVDEGEPMARALRGLP